MSGVKTLKALFDEKRIRILQILIQKPDEEFTLKELTKKGKVSLATTHRILKQLTKLSLITATEKKHLTTYTLAKNEDALFMAKLLYEKPAPIAKFIDEITPIHGIEQIIMHGKATENRANIVIIGSNIPKDEINLIVARIKEDYLFTLSHLILEHEQFQMLESMGQFSGSKTVLFTR